MKGEVFNTENYRRDSAALRREDKYVQILYKPKDLVTYIYLQTDRGHLPSTIGALIVKCEQG